MKSLPERIGWTKTEGLLDEFKRTAYSQLHLPTRAMNVLVPWRRGLERTRPGYQSMDWEEAKRSQEELEQVEKAKHSPTRSRGTPSSPRDSPMESVTVSIPDTVSADESESALDDGDDAADNLVPSRVSMMEHHYYQMDEVWHALYHRAEMRHLNDPENPCFKDDTSQSKAVRLFKDIMKVTP